MKYPKQLLNKAIETENKLVHYPYGKKWKKLYLKYKDEALNRELVGVDKYGNQYYQYYSFHGLPTKRIVLYKFFDGNQFVSDVHFISWLHRRQQLPPTPEDLERLYMTHDDFIKRGIEWDKKEKEISQLYQKNKKVNLIDQEIKKEKAALEGKLKVTSSDDFTPEKWIAPKRKEKRNYEVPHHDVNLLKSLEIDLENMTQKAFKEHTFDIVLMGEKMNQVYKARYEEKLDYMYGYLHSSNSVGLLEDSNSEDNKKILGENNNPLKESSSLVKNSKSSLTTKAMMLEKKSDFKRYNQFHTEFGDIFNDFAEIKSKDIHEQTNDSTEYWKIEDNKDDKKNTISSNF